MAKKIKDEDLVLNVIINGNKSKKEMQELERAIADTNHEINALKKQQKELAAQGQSESQAYKTLTFAINEKNKAIQMAEARLIELRKGMKLTEMSIMDLQKEQARLNKLWKTSTPDSENAKKYREQLDLVTQRLDELRNKATNTGFSLKGLADKFNHYMGVITAGLVSMIGLLSGITKITNAFAEFDDKVADVRKTTGLMRTDVIGLNEDFKKIDTRSTQEDLLGLAQVAGKLGIGAKEDVLGFVRAADQISVALSEDLGGDVEEAINSVGKLVDIFNLKNEFGIEKSLLKVGSAINVLGASSTANEGYLVEFTKRMAGVAPLAGVTIQQILGLGATLDQFGQTAEVSSTALSKLFINMAADANTYAKYAGMSVDQFKKSLETDFSGTFVRVLEGVKNNSQGINELAASLGDLDLEGGRVVGVLGTLANNTETLKKQIALSNDAFKEGTSLTQEFAIKNETAGAKLDKSKKALYNLTIELGERLYPAMSLSIDGFVKLVKIVSILIGFLFDNRKAIITIVSAVIAYNAVVMIQNALTGESILLKKAEIALAKLKVFWDNAQAGAMHLLGAAYLVAQGEIRAARAEMVLFNNVTKLNPLAMFVAALVAAVVAIKLYGSQLSDAEKAQRSFIKIQETAEQRANDEKQTIKELVDQLKSENSTRGQKETIINKLREIMPSYLSGYTDEEIMAGKAKASIDSYIDSLERRTRAEAAQERIRELQKRNIALKNNDGSTREGFWGGVNETFQSIYGAVGLDSQVKRLRKNNMDDYKAEIAENAKEIVAIQKQFKADIEANAVTPVTPSDVNTAKFKIETPDEKKARLKAERDAAIEAEKKRKAALAAIKKQQEDERKYRDSLSDPTSPELQQENKDHEERLKKAGLFGKNMAKLTQEQLQALEILQNIHQSKIDKIDADAIKTSIDQKQQAYQEELADLKISHNDELEEVTSLASAKSVLEKYYSAKEVATVKTVKEARIKIKEAQSREENALTEKYALDLIEKLKGVLAGGALEGVSFADQILSDEEKKKLEASVKDLKRLLAGLKEKPKVDDVVDKKYSFVGSKTDVLGFTAEDWDLLFVNLQNSKLSINDVAMAVGALASAYSTYNDIVTRSETAKLKKFEKSNQTQKDELQKRLESGRISQDRYNKEVAKLDADLDEKKAKIEKDQANRQKVLAALNVVSSTAQAIIGIWAQVPKFDFGISAGILSGIVAGIGAAQLAAVLAAPGLEEGGYVRRTQDSKLFKAKNKGKKRGYMDETSVLVSENGREFVASADAVSNPNVKQVLDVIDSAQRNGTVSTLNLEKMMYRSSSTRAMAGKEKGGYVTDSTDQSTVAPGQINVELLSRYIESVDKLNAILDKGIVAQVALLGKDGFIAKMAEFNNTVDNSSL